MQTPIIVTVSNTRAQVVGAGGVGFRLEPLGNVQTGNEVAMDVEVRVDRQPAQVYRLRDDAPRRFAERFDVLEIVGGRLGDQWLVTIFDSPADGVGAPGRVLRRSPIIVQKLGWTAAEKTPGLKKYLGGSEGQVVGLGAAAWLDVSAYRSLCFYARALDGNGGDANDGQGYTLTCELAFYADAQGQALMEKVTSPALQVTAQADWRVSIGAGRPPTGDATWAGVPRRYPYVSVAYWLGNGSNSASSDFTGNVCLSGVP